MSFVFMYLVYNEYKNTRYYLLHEKLTGSTSNFTDEKTFAVK